jgi:hypothetical protein
MFFRTFFKLQSFVAQSYKVFELQNSKFDRLVVFSPNGNGKPAGKNCSFSWLKKATKGSSFLG